jgi:hypothetical protein
MPLKGAQTEFIGSRIAKPLVISHSTLQSLKDIISTFPNETVDTPVDTPRGSTPSNDALLVLLPLLIVLSTFLFLLLFFLVCVILIRRRRGIILRDSDGPVDMSREELMEGEGGLEGVESRWLENINEFARRSYLRAKGMYFLCITAP